MWLWIVQFCIVQNFFKSHNPSWIWLVSSTFIVGFWKLIWILFGTIQGPAVYLFCELFDVSCASKILRFFPLLISAVCSPFVMINKISDIVWWISMNFSISWMIFLQSHSRIFSTCIQTKLTWHILESHKMIEFSNGRVISVIWPHKRLYLAYLVLFWVIALLNTKNKT